MIQYKFLLIANKVALLLINVNNNNFIHASKSDFQFYNFILLPLELIISN